MKKNLTLVCLCIATSGIWAQTAELGEVSITAQSSSEKPIYRPSPPRTTDVVHTELKVELDWEKQHLIGEAILTLKPYFYELDTFVLDAKGMEIVRISEAGPSQQRALEYRYDGLKLHVSTGRKLTRNDQMKIRIEYIAKPNELEIEGGAAISEAKGLYFINPEGNERGYMPQVWTQGEPQSSSVWFPTVDEPNERMTHEIAITVPDSYTTVSNGRLEMTLKNRDGSRTDFWLMDQPHAPYLVMMAIGEFKSQSDEWHGIPVNYYVEPEYADVAREVYPNTLEMLDFFSELLGTPYPWQKYDQVTVREYVSGAMENTTGVIFGDFMYGDSLSWADGTGEDVVSHEMFHHWFGDYVTCESWANLPLNESFATYGEVLWKEHKYGEDEAAWHSYGDLRSYLREFNRGKSEDLIRYDYESVLGMFDSHSYAKGGRVLLMLRTIIGDEAFFEGLRVYLKDNAYSAVEIHNLRLAFEKVTGQDLNGFFNQWFLAKGHPQLRIEHKFDQASGEQIMTVTQTQDLTQTPLYQLPVKVDVYTSLGLETHEILISKEVEEFRFEVLSKPFLVHFDSEQYLLAEIDDQKPIEFLLHQLANGPKMMDRYEALQAVMDQPVVNLGTIVRIGLEDEFWAIRALALSKVPEIAEKDLSKVKDEVEALLNDPEPSIRQEAYRQWFEVFGFDEADFYKERFASETSYSAKAGAFAVLKELDAAYALQEAKKGFGHVRGDLAQWMAVTLLEDVGNLTADEVINYLNTLSPEMQPQFNLWLPKFLIQLNDSERARVVEVVKEVHQISEEAASYFRYGMRIAKAGIQRDLQDPELTQEQKDIRKIWESRLENLLPREG